MDNVLQQIISKFDEYIGGLIDFSKLTPEKKDKLKFHLLAAQDILVDAGATQLHAVVSGVTQSILSRF